MNAQYQNILILSAERSDKDDSENQLRTSILENTLNVFNTPYQKVVGSWKGETENSFIVIPQNEWVKNFLIGHVLYFWEQDSVLEQSTEGLIYFIDGTKKPTPTGQRLTKVPEAVALQQEGYTKKNNSYWILK